MLQKRAIFPQFLAPFRSPASLWLDAYTKGMEIEAEKITLRTVVILIREFNFLLTVRAQMRAGTRHRKAGRFPWMKQITMRTVVSVR